MSHKLKARYLKETIKITVNSLLCKAKNRTFIYLERHSLMFSTLKHDEYLFNLSYF